MYGHLAPPHSRSLTILNLTCWVRGTSLRPSTGDKTQDLSGRGTARAEDAQGTPTQRHISPSILVDEDKKPGSPGCVVQTD